jgi:hypothetical protein
LFGREVDDEFVDGEVAVDFVQIDGKHVALEPVGEPIGRGCGRGHFDTEPISSHDASINGIRVGSLARERTADELIMRDC